MISLVCFTWPRSLKGGRCQNDPRQATIESLPEQSRGCTSTRLSAGKQAAAEAPGAARGRSPERSHASSPVSWLRQKFPSFPDSSNALSLICARCNSACQLSNAFNCAEFRRADAVYAANRAKSADSRPYSTQSKRNISLPTAISFPACRYVKAPAAPRR